MNRTEFITVTSIILFGAFLLGWIASWLVHRMTRPAQADMTELDRMAQQLHEAEEQRDQAVALLEEREAVLSSRLAGTEAELRAAMDGLRESRTEIEELRDFIERKLARR
jgi:prophage endopeptidase